MHWWVPIYVSNNYVGFTITGIDLDPAGLDQLYIYRIYSNKRPAPN